jgi:hypothetical protein
MADVSSACAGLWGAVMGITLGLSPYPLWVSSQQSRQILQRGDGVHALGREHAAALQLTVLVQLQQHGTHQACD